MTQLVLIALLILTFLGLRRILRQTPLARLSARQQTLMALGLMLLLVLIFSGRLGMLIPLLGAFLAALLAAVGRLLPIWLPLLVQSLPRWLRRQGPHAGPGGAATGTSPDSSAVETRYLRMHLRHDTGELSGIILQGPKAGRWLAELDRRELMELYGIYSRNDTESARLLEAYIERQLGNRWHDHDAESHAPIDNSGMGRSEALEILGLPPDASREDIIAAHRRLIQKVHPDRGGSDYLAAKINQAKDLLLDL